ncbi:MAG: hypothetical protein RPU90_15215 [Candidatus Sedimenticola sp. (ex Thyasira tokunagai)]
MKKGEQSLLNRLPDRGSAKANWKQNSGVIRQEISSGDSWAGDGWSDAGSTGGGWVDGSGDPITDGSGDPIGSVDYGGGGNVCSGSSCSNKSLAPGILGHWVPEGIVNGKQWCACVANDPTSHPIYTNSNRLGMSMPGVYPGPSSAAGLENVPWSDSTGSGGGGPLSQSTGIHSTVKDLSQNLAVNLVFDAESVYASYNAFNNGRTVEGIAYLGLGIIGTVNPFGKAGKAYKLGKLAFGRVFRAGKRTGLETRGIRPQPGTRVKPDGIPDNWRIGSSKSKGGVKYTDPKNPHNNVRVEQGVPGHPHANSRSPHVRDVRNGQYVDGGGRPVSGGRRDPAGHIPLDGYRYRF